MILREKLEGWMDRWVGTARLTAVPKTGMSASGTFKELEARPCSMGTAKSGSIIHMQDVFFLREKTEKKHPRDTVALYLSDREVIAVRHPDTGELDHLIPLRNTRGLTPLWGCFSESGEESVALYDPESGCFRIWESINDAEPRYQFLFGPAGLGWIPLIGDWDADGLDGIGIYCPETSTFLLKNALEDGTSDLVFMFGVPDQGWIPITGDWDGDGQTGIGLFVPKEGVFYLKNALQGGEHETEVRIISEASNLIPMAGDWSERGRDAVALFDPASGVFHLGSTDTLQTIWPRFSFGKTNEVVTPLRVQWAPQFRDADIELVV
jgi:hypothetical protein